MTHVSQLLFLLAVFVVLSKGAGALARRAGQPAVFGELLLGVVLGPSVLNTLGFHIFDHATILPAIKDFAEIGVILLMFLAGLETDLAEMKKVGLAALSGAAGGVILPLLAGTGLSLAFGLSLAASIFVGAVLTATSVSISAQTLIELDQLRSKEGTTILGAAVIDDVMGIIVLSLVVAFTAHSGASGGTALIFVKMAIYFALALWFGRYVPRLLGAFEKVPASEMLLASALAVCFVYSFLAEYLGSVAPITGAYIAGVIIGQSEFKTRVLHKLEIVGYSLFTPIFFVSIGLEANARDLGSSLGYTLVIVAAAILTKLVGAGLGVRLVGFSPRESLRVGVGMISRGEVALIAAAIGLSNGIIDGTAFAAMVVMTLVTTLVTPVVLRRAFAAGSSK